MLPKPYTKTQLQVLSSTEYSVVTLSEGIKINTWEKHSLDKLLHCSYFWSQSVAVLLILYNKEYGNKVTTG